MAVSLASYTNTPLGIIKATDEAGGSENLLAGLAVYVRSIASANSNNS